MIAWMSCGPADHFEKVHNELAGFSFFTFHFSPALFCFALALHGVRYADGQSIFGANHRDASKQNLGRGKKHFHLVSGFFYGVHLDL